MNVEYFLWLNFEWNQNGHTLIHSFKIVESY